MISNEKNQTLVNKEKDFFLNTVKLVKEKPLYWAAFLPAILLALLASSIAKSNAVRGLKAPVPVTAWIGSSILWFIIALAFLVVITYIVFRKFIYPKIEINTGEKDDREFRYSEEHPYGTARPNTAEDLKEILEFKDIEDTYGTIIGFDERTGKIVSIPTIEEFEKKAKELGWVQDDKTNNSRNRNTLVIGSPGTMKSRAVIMNEILQSIKAGESIIVTDPKADLYEKTHNILEENGYDVKMFNLKDQEYSDSCNMVAELENDSTFAKIYAETLVNNADEDGEKFWNDNAMNFIKACLMLDDIDTMGKLYDFVSGRTLEEFDNIFNAQDQRSVALRAYNIFKQCSDQVKGQIINGLGIMIDVFQDEKVRNITNTSEMDLTKPAREKCAYFVITSDQHRTFDYLAVLFWTMAFIKLIEYIDKNRDEKGDPTTHPVHLLLDEFPNIGAIPDFNRKLSTVRSRLLYATIVIQNIPQLMNRYPNGMYEEIFSDCDFVVFLGCNDNTTAEYVSKLTGIASIEVTTENRVYNNSQITLNQSVEMRKVKSIGQRTVMNADEVRSIPNTDMLVFIRGTKSVYQCKKFDYSKHPFAEKLTPYKVVQHIPQWKKDLQAEEEEKIRIAKEISEKKETEKLREKELQENARKKDELKKKARDEAVKNEETQWFEQMNNQLDFNSIVESINSLVESIPKSNSKSELKNSEVNDSSQDFEQTENLDNEIIIPVAETTIKDDDVNKLLSEMAKEAPISKPKSNKSNKPLQYNKKRKIVIEDLSSNKDAA